MLVSVQERSKQETRFDRNTAGEPDSNGTYGQFNNDGYTVPSASPAVSTPTKRTSMNPYAQFLTNSPPPAAATSPPQSPNSIIKSNNPYRALSEQPSPPSNNFNFDFLDSYTNSEQDNLQAPLKATTATANGLSRSNAPLGVVIPSTSAEDDDDSILTPLQPSEKALGKMRSASYTAPSSG